MLTYLSRSYTLCEILYLLPVFTGILALPQLPMALRAIGIWRKPFAASPASCCSPRHLSFLPAHRPTPPRLAPDSASHISARSRACGYAGACEGFGIIVGSAFPHLHAALSPAFRQLTKHCQLTKPVPDETRLMEALRFLPPSSHTSAARVPRVTHWGASTRSAVCPSCYGPQKM